jgi:hypothetical protein
MVDGPWSVVSRHQLAAPGSRFSDYTPRRRTAKEFKLSSPPPDGQRRRIFCPYFRPHFLHLLLLHFLLLHFLLDKRLESW